MSLACLFSFFLRKDAESVHASYFLKDFFVFSSRQILKRQVVMYVMFNGQWDFFNPGFRVRIRAKTGRVRVLPYNILLYHRKAKKQKKTIVPSLPSKIVSKNNFLQSILGKKFLKTSKILDFRILGFLRPKPWFRVGVSSLRFPGIRVRVRPVQHQCDNLEIYFVVQFSIITLKRDVPKSHFVFN